MPTYYITKWALSNNGKPTVVESARVPREDGIIWLARPGQWDEYHKMGRDVFGTQEEARQAILVARDKRIASLEAQIAKLRKIGEKPT